MENVFIAKTAFGLKIENGIYQNDFPKLRKINQTTFIVTELDKNQMYLPYCFVFNLHCTQKVPKNKGEDKRVLGLS